MFLSNADEKPIPQDTLKQALQQCENAHLVNFNDMLDVDLTLRESIDRVIKEMQATPAGRHLLSDTC